MLVGDVLSSVCGVRINKQVGLETTVEVQQASGFTHVWGKCNLSATSTPSFAQKIVV